MCGIAGIVSAEPVDLAVVESMRDSLAHRGPDHAGLWAEPSRQVCLAHRRLAIVDLSAGANQPFLSEDGRWAVTFNGEIYNFRELARQLERKGVQFRTHSDTEVLVESYREWGEECLERFSGMFAFALWDRRERKLFCARDRTGEKPFYYCSVGRTFLFGSEVKALTAWPGFPRRLHLPAVADYLSFGFVPDPKCIWEGCLKLPPGHFLRVNTGADGSPAVEPPTEYWDLRFDPDETESNWDERIRETLVAAAREMIVADVPVGTFLSGGVDSSAVTAALSRDGHRVKTFTIGFDEAGFDERPFAAEVAGLCRTDHTVAAVAAGDVRTVFARLLSHYDEPFNDYSYLPTFYVCREARKSITVALSGDGGDEVFGGYSKYRRLALRADVGRFVPELVSTAISSGLSLALPSGHGLHDKLSAYRTSADRMLMRTLTTVFAPDDVKTASRGPLRDLLRGYRPEDVVTALIRQAPPSRVGLSNTMRYLDFKLTLAGDMLVKVDRASMAVALEVRPVFLNRSVIELASRIPPRLLADRREAKKLLKSSLRPWLPDSILYRKKMGFAMPLRKWIDGDLKAFFGERTPGPADELVDFEALQAIASRQSSSALQAHSLFFLRHWANHYLA